MEEASAVRRELSPTTQLLPGQRIVTVLEAAEKVHTAVHAGAVEQAVNQSRQAQPAFRDLDLALADQIQRLDASWSSQMTSTRDVPALRAGIIAPAALAVLLAAWGFGARLAEYRVRGQG